MKKQLLFGLALLWSIFFSSCETKCDIAKDIDELRAERIILQRETASLSLSKDQISSQISKLNEKVKELKIYESGNVPHYYMRLQFTPTTLRIRNVVVNSFTIEIPVDKRFYESNDVGASCGRMTIESKWITK